MQMHSVYSQYELNRGTRTVKFKYEIEISHAGLKKYRHISGTNRLIVESKARHQLAQWDDQFSRQIEREERARKRSAEANLREAQRRTFLAERRVAKEEKELREREGAEDAARRTGDAQGAIRSAESLLSQTLATNDAIDFAELYDRRTFGDPKPSPPTLPSLPLQPSLRNVPRPDPSWRQFAPQKSLWTLLFPWLRRRNVRLASKAFYRELERFQESEAADEADMDNWRKQTEVTREAQRKMAEEFRLRAEAWIKNKSNFERESAEQRAAVDNLKKKFEADDPEALQEYFTLVLERSAYPDFIPHDFELQYLATERRVIVEFRLPLAEDLPSIVEVKYVKSTGGFVEKSMSKTETNRLYDVVAAQLVLRTIHEIFESDVRRAVDAVIFNGYLNYVDKTTGRDASGVLITVGVSRHEFEQLDLTRIEPVACLRALKAIFAPKIHSITPVKPLDTIRRDDRRFVEGKQTLAELETAMNIATMSWEDFEHLVRELFEREFSHSGGEVKVTRASRDGGVDAVIFDPDPIRGGKLVVQAKRYTNTVGVSAVRDLYGTLVNEGANKGILVTTSHFGNDAFEFAKGKPITLIDGANLLYLLERHGHSVRIDLEEARSLNSK